jgi:Rab3 GTPase-activating protein regulatory subunit N-terminus
VNAGKLVGVAAGAIGGVFGFIGIGRHRSSQHKSNSTHTAAAHHEEHHDDKHAALTLQTVALDDERRTVQRMWAAPSITSRSSSSSSSSSSSAGLVATADSYGRVLLLDTHSCTVLRMWKGLRDAHCGWLQAVERWEGGRVVEVLCDSSSSSSAEAIAAAAAATATSREGLQSGSGLRIGLYLVILAPQRGFVEVSYFKHCFIMSA